METLTMTSKFKVYDPASNTLGLVESFVFIFVPLLLRDGLPKVLCYALCGMFALVWVIFALSKKAYLTVDEVGLHCNRPFKKVVTIKWAELACSGTYSRTIYGKEKNFMYFATRHFSGTISDAQAKQIISEDYFFAFKTAELEKTIKKYLSDK